MAAGRRARNLRVDSGFNQVVDQRLSRSVSWLSLPVVLAAMLLLAVAPEADAQFRGKNGRVFYISADASGNQRVFSSKASGSGRKIVSPEGLDPSSLAVSPNGRRLAICGGRAADVDDWIFVGRVSGGKFRRVVKGCDPGFSPSGKRLVYTVALPNGLRDRYEIRTVGTDGKSRRTVFRPSDRWLSDTMFTPNGKRIVFTATIDPNVGVPIGGGPIDIIATPESDQFDYNYPIYSPDGKRVIFERGDSAFVEYYLIFQGRLTGALPNQSLQNPPLVVPSPPASPFGAFGPVWAARPR